MAADNLKKFSTGVLSPLSSLRSNHSTGTGEFADLPLLADWVTAAGCDLIQVLPVNDTGADSSPYSALSAFALHPLYIRLQDLPELAGHDDLVAELETLHAELSTAPRLEYARVLDAKESYLWKLYQTSCDEITKDSEFQHWLDGADWVRDYAVFRLLKWRNNGAAWWQWSEYTDPDDALIETFWSDGEQRKALLFYAWVQFRLEQQLRAAKDALDTKGVILKGDIPILMNEDSVDLWRRRRFFHRGLRAGAPPDMFSALGQNWGFPIYDWEELEAENYSWWRSRVRRAAQFYHAYRIDHVLGFFRIWAIPAANESGILGRFAPSAGLSLAELNAAGFSADRVNWLAEPHLGGEELRAALNQEFDSCVTQLLRQMPDEDLYLFGSRVTGERDIFSADCSADSKNFLVERFRDRALLKVADDLYIPSWSFRDCSRYQVLHDGEKHAFEGLVQRIGRENEALWEEHGRKTLGMLRETVDTLPCAEDLGVVPDSVPDVLSSLGILSLKLPRWTRNYDLPGEPFVSPQAYPFLSVCAPSVHDTSTLREWWERELNDQERSELWALFALDGEPRSDFDPELAADVLGALLKTSSVFCVFQLQDLFALESDLIPEDPAEERVNIPGTANDFNWSYRIPKTLEALADMSGLTGRIRSLVDERNKRSIT